MARLLACPFCRELFPPGERQTCPSCELKLVDLNKLPLSDDALALEEPAPRDPPEDVNQSWSYVGRGRGVLVGLALLGLASFFAPWVRLVRPDSIELSGFDLARGNVGYLWAGAIGWFLLVPLVASRRSVTQLRGARVVACTFALLTLIEGLLLLLRPPVDNSYFRAQLSYGYGLYLSCFLSLVGCGIALRLGGSLSDLRDLEAGSRSARRVGEAIH